MVRVKLLRMNSWKELRGVRAEPELYLTYLEDLRHDGLPGGALQTPQGRDAALVLQLVTIIQHQTSLFNLNVNFFQSFYNKTSSQVRYKNHLTFT